jgi:hypothetical protein
METQYLTVEFHCHTQYSPDSLTKLAELLDACEKKSIDRLVITDHNTIEGALIAKKLDPERVIVGEEIRTTQGELLAAFVQEQIPRGLTPEEAVSRLRDQGAFISVSHPFDRRGGGWTSEQKERLTELVDAIEVFNARCVPDSLNAQALAYAEQKGLLGTVGSDAHSLMELGRATMRLPAFEDAEGLRESLREVEYVTDRMPFGARFFSNYARFAKHFGLDS